jgi:hypothetical protein
MPQDYLHRVYLQRARNQVSLVALRRSCTVLHDSRHHPEHLIIGDGKRGFVVEFVVCKTAAAARKMPSPAERSFPFLKLPQYQVRLVAKPKQRQMLMLLDAALLKRLPIESEDEMVVEVI